MDFKKVATMTSLTLSEYTVSEPQTCIAMKTITAHYDTSNAWSKGIVSCVCLKMSKQIKREKKYSEHCFYFVVKVKPTFVFAI